MYQVGINKGIILRCTAYQISRYDEANSRFSQFFEQAYILHKYDAMDISGYINNAYGSYNPDYYKK